MRLGFSKRWWLAALSLAVTFPAMGSPAFIPYTTDDQTLHLWHLDEAGAPFKDDGVSPTPLLGLINGAQAGQAPFPGFGAAVAFNQPDEGPETRLPYGPILLAKPTLDYGPRDNVEAPFPIAGADGAFTIEAVVKLDFLPEDAWGGQLAKRPIADVWRVCDAALNAPHSPRGTPLRRLHGFAERAANIRGRSRRYCAGSRGGHRLWLPECHHGHVSHYGGRFAFARSFLRGSERCPCA